MKKLFLIEDSLANQISYYHLMLLMASLPFNMFYSHLILISFTIHTLIQLKAAHIKTVFTFKVLALQSVFFLTVIFTIYSVNRPEAYNEWGRQLPILVMPVLFCLTTLDINKYRSQLLLAFSLVCTATIVYLYFDAFITIWHYHLPWSAILSTAFINHNFSEPIDMHATFFSLQLAIALVYLLSVLIAERSNYIRLFYLLCVLILAAGLIQLCSKSVFIALFIIINAALPWLLLRGSARFKFIIATILVSVIIVIGIFAMKTFKVRYITDLKIDLSLSENTTTDTRLDRWDAATQLIKQSPIIGHGSGTEISLLQDVFFHKKYYDSYLKKLNSHNQYLSFLIKSGIIGLLIYLGTLAFGFKAALQNKDLLLLTFMLLIALVSFSENLLDVDKGVLFYAFFFPFLLFSSGHPKR